MLDEHWGSSILRHALDRVSYRADELQVTVGIPEHILGERLDAFIHSGLMDAERDPARGDDLIYRLTDQGRDLEPILTALDQWKQRWVAPVRFVVVDTGSVDESQRPGEPRLLGDEPPAPAVTVAAEISLLGTFTVRSGGVEQPPLPKSSQRLLAYLALNDRAVGRGTVAGTLWPDSTEFRAATSLRSALSRLDGLREAVVKSPSGLCLGASVEVDLRDAQALAQRLLRSGSSPDELDLSAEAIAALSLELLPDWYDDWAVDAAEDWRQTRMNALEVQARTLIEGDRLAEAAGVAQTVMRVEPLRESAHALLVRIHFAGGNQSEALRVFEDYRTLLLGELGLQPTAMLSQLVAGIRDR
jgi:DNA-binding SARP family transcriptional activator/DNA-binding HxlR family transcriptional regulator